ncbi:MAG TPA: acyl-CoA dehydrogenase [Saprospiraceae bacterium]|nr:acyl-CoA dehydrogenase [Saprospiraceae bacterium]HPN67924.1 acyl-CoA dehydrogenase [Saprospiraceae bacterium]
MSVIAHQTYSPGVLSMLPLFYVGWSDSVLSPSEMKIIHQKIKDFDFLTPADKKYLIQYTNPQFPPSEELFKSWMSAMKEAVANMPKSKIQSLSELGLEIAKASISYKNDQLWQSPEVVTALLEIESELGVYNDEGLNGMLLQLDGEKLKVKPKSISFETDKMQLLIDGKYLNTKKKVRKLLRDPVFSYGHIIDKDLHRAKVLELTKILAEQGLGAMGFEEKFGGKNQIGDYMAVFEILAMHDLSLTVKFGVQFGLFGGAIHGLGTEKHHKKYIEALGKAEILGCFAMTETGHGSNVKDLETTATYLPETGEIEIHSPTFSAGKEYIGNALHGSLAVVFAQLFVSGSNQGIHAIIVPYRDQAGNTLPGITVKDCGYKMGLNGVDNGRLWFDHVRVPRENLLDKYGGVDEIGKYHSPIQNENRRFFTMLGALVAGRICVGHGALNAAKTALTIAVKYALKRKQFGPEGHEEQLIMDYPTHQARLIPLIVKNYAFHFSLSTLRELYINAVDEVEKRKVETKAAGLKAMATWLATQTIQECREACGGKGYLTENRLSELKANSDIFTTFEGDNTVLLQLVSKGLLTEFKQSFHDDGFSSVMRYLFGKLSFSLTENNPYFRRNTSLEHLMSDDFLSDALRYREKKTLISLSERMRDYLKKRINPYDAFLKCQLHMVDLAKAYVERLVYRDFFAAIHKMEDGAEKVMLDKIGRYYALTIIFENKGFYLENDYMDGSKTKAIRRLLHKMTQELRTEVEGLVDSFGIPFESIRAEILKED